MEESEEILKGVAELMKKQPAYSLEAGHMLGKDPKLTRNWPRIAPTRSCALAAR